LIKFVILLVIVITYPFITAIVYIGTRFISVPVSYLAGGMVGNLYVPLIAILVGMIFFIAIKCIYLNLYINKKLLDVEVKRTKLTFKEILVILCLVVAGVGLVFNSLTMEWNLIQDIPHLAHSDFAVAEGEITLYEISHGDTSETRMMIDGIKMDGGFEYEEQLVDHAKYYVEYLPHSKYVVRYHRISYDLKKI
jgi:hypothetical protein